VTALIRPEAIEAAPDPDSAAKVLTSSFLGSLSRVTVTVDDHLVVAQVPSGRLPELAPGTPVRITIQPVAVALE
jgi:putative spermidine/putrescine transport system ATP-binding protein